MATNPEKPIVSPELKEASLALKDAIELRALGVEPIMVQDRDDESLETGTFIERRAMVLATEAGERYQITSAYNTRSQKVICTITDVSERPGRLIKGVGILSVDTGNQLLDSRHSVGQHPARFNPNEYTGSIEITNLDVLHELTALVRDGHEEQPSDTTEEDAPDSRSAARSVKGLGRLFFRDKK